MGVLKRVHLWMIAIRDSFVTLLPVTFFGVVAFLVKDFPLPVYQSMMTEYWGLVWQKQLQLIIDATHGLFGVTLCVLLSIYLANRLRRQGSEEIPHLMAGLSGLTNFMILAAAQGPLTSHSLGHDSILIAIGVGIFSAEALCWAAEARWLNLVRMPHDTDPIFHHAIRLTPPLIVIGLAVATASFGYGLLPEIETNPWQDLIELAQSHGAGVWWLSSITVLINQIVWFLGSQGSYVLDGASLFSS